MPLHHVAYATRDVDATTHFYEDLMGFPLVHTEVQAMGESWLRHVFYDIGPNGDGEGEDALHGRSYPLIPDCDQWHWPCVRTDEPRVKP